VKDDVVSAVALVVETDEQAEVPPGEEGSRSRSTPARSSRDDDTTPMTSSSTYPNWPTTGSPGSSTRTSDPFAE
jgi:hypothetical protein